MKKCLLLAFSLLWIGWVGKSYAQDKPGSIGITPSEEDVRNTVRKPSYSPYAGRNFPTQVYWGDTHVHTNNSLDARGFGVTLGPEEAYRFARGEEVTPRQKTGSFSLDRVMEAVQKGSGDK